MRSTHEYLPIASDPHSVFGVGSLATGVLAALAMALLVMIGMRSGFTASDIASAPLAWRAGIWIGFAATMIGVVLGIFGLFHTDHRKMLSITGLAINAAVFLTVGVLVGLGVVGI